MKFQINIGSEFTANLRAIPGAVMFNGARLLPHEARVLGSRLKDCAEGAHDKAEALEDACNLSAGAARDLDRASILSAAAA